MNIAQHTWPLYYPGSEEYSVLPELLEEKRKAEEDGGLVFFVEGEAAWRIFHVRPS